MKSGIIKSIYKKNMLRIQNVWFANEDEIADVIEQGKKSKADVLYIHGVSFKSSPKGWNKQYTVFSDLNGSLEELHEKIRKNYRYEIRRAEKEGVVVREYDGNGLIEETALLDSFQETYNRMYFDKGMKVVFNRAQVEQYLRDGCMFLTIGFFGGIPYVFHSYIYNDDCARLHCSASSFRSNRDATALIGRINKAVHWHDMRMFKEKGIVNYDWGGISDKDAPNGIDQFKMAFGGQVKEYFNIFIGITIKGKAAVRIKNATI